LSIDLNEVEGFSGIASSIIFILFIENAATDDYVSDDMLVLHVYVQEVTFKLQLVDGLFV
jgi:hypothetical protein